MTTTTLVHQAVLYEQRTVVRREAMKDVAVVPWLVRTLTEIRDYLAKRGIEPLSPPYARIRTVIDQKVVDAGYAVREGSATTRMSGHPGCHSARRRVLSTMASTGR